MSQTRPRPLKLRKSIIPHSEAQTGGTGRKAVLTGGGLHKTLYSCFIFFIVGPDYFLKAIKRIQSVSWWRCFTASCSSAADARRQHVLRADGMRSPGGGCQLIHMVFRETNQPAFETMAPPAATDSRIASQKTYEIIHSSLRGGKMPKIKSLQFIWNFFSLWGLHEYF